MRPLAQEAVDGSPRMTGGVIVGHTVLANSGRRRTSHGSSSLIPAEFRARTTNTGFLLRWMTASSKHPVGKCVQPARGGTGLVPGAWLIGSLRRRRLRSNSSNVRRTFNTSTYADDNPFKSLRGAYPAACSASNGASTMESPSRWLVLDRDILIRPAWSQTGQTRLSIVPPWRPSLRACRSRCMRWAASGVHRCHRVARRQTCRSHEGLSFVGRAF